jgi:aerobic carbon-monoxide dehydrogenase medium subunit
MYPPPFDYERPTALSEAIELLRAHDGEAIVLAGGHSLLPRLKLRETRPSVLVDVNRLGELGGGVAVNGIVSIASLTRHVDVARSTAMAETVPLLIDLASRIGDPQVRNAGTVGGAAAEVYPGGDWAPALVTLGAELVCHGPAGERRISARDRFAAAGQVELGSAEILVRIEFPVPPDGSGGVHLRLERRRGIAVCNCSVQVSLDDDGVYRTVAAAWGGLRPGPVVAERLEEVLVGEPPGPDLHRRAAEEALREVASYSDVRGSEGYRQKVAAVLLRRGLEAAARRANGEDVEVRDVI